MPMTETKVSLLLAPAREVRSLAAQVTVREKQAGVLRNVVFPTIKG